MPNAPLETKLAAQYEQQAQNDLDVLERGYAHGPMDPDKVVVEDGRPAALEPYPCVGVRTLRLT